MAQNKKQGTIVQGAVVWFPKCLREAEYDKILVTPNTHPEIVNILLREKILPVDIIYPNDIQHFRNWL